jgi:DNA-binding transcriptional LysR family regulator
MELRQLEYLVAVVEEAHFTRAAQRLHVAQPGVSAQIRHLERELGQPLLDRSGRTVRTTEIGAAVLPYARAALAAVSGMRSAVEEFTGLLRGHVSVGMITSSFNIPDLLAEFHRKHPELEITLTEATSDHSLQALHEGELDLAVIGMPNTAPAGIETQVVADQALVAAVAPEDPLAARKKIRLDALRDRALISLPRGTGMRSTLEEACAATGFAPRIGFEASDPVFLAQLAERGLGVAIVPESLAAFYPDDLHAVAITHPAMRGQVALAWRSDGPTSPAARALIQHARAFLASSDPHAR